MSTGKRIRLGACAVVALAASMLASSTTPAAAVGYYSGLPYVTGGGTFTDDFGDEGILQVGGPEGSRGSNAICLWQRILWAHGYLAETEIDGIFGLKTQDATKKLQRWFGLTADGSVGKGTWGAVDSWSGAGLRYVSGSEADGQNLYLQYQGPYSGYHLPLTRDQYGHYLFIDRKGNVRAAGYDYNSCS
ncbi:peptidoglycan-binding protein [Streptomyces sp. VRA16 Mangrove soil]|uniref:peptidoglycan-binding domain-containing protein n=1 Tax=Streptomyces sp. VRA16 Mangrove soil TaxID=2817434 RepID=UPI001A9EB153|nr:peptidoglycan-binding domain-containing protein [Streptomyces sp. VRA16 Mangrove soil]MBO1331395.1 peptidoglycan-binding protein [Streptomyces sp. VRA16 Mangrove soil]